MYVYCLSCRAQKFSENQDHSVRRDWTGGYASQIFCLSYCPASGYENRYWIWQNRLSSKELKNYTPWNNFLLKLAKSDVNYEVQQKTRMDIELRKKPPLKIIIFCCMGGAWKVTEGWEDEKIFTNWKAIKWQDLQAESR